MKRLLLISIYLFVGCASTVSKYSSREYEIFIGPTNDDLLKHPYINITNKKSTELISNFIPTPLPTEPNDIIYNIQEMDGIRIGINILMKSNDDMSWISMMENPESPLSKNYQVKMFIENVSDKDIIINPSSYIIDDKGILFEADVNTFLPSLYRMADMEPIFVQLGPAPKKPTLEYNSGTIKSGTIKDATGNLVGTYTETKNTSVTDALNNLSNVLKYQRELEKHRVEQAMANIKAKMVEDRKNMSIKYIQYILTNWLKYEYRIPPNAKVTSVLYFQNTNNITPITFNVKISDKLFQFKSAKIIPKWEIQIKRPNQGVSFAFIVPHKIKWSEQRNSLVITAFDEGLSEKKALDIMYLNGIKYIDSSLDIKSWTFSGTLDERYQEFVNIKNYVDNEKEKGLYYRQ